MNIQLKSVPTPCVLLIAKTLHAPLEKRRGALQLNQRITKEIFHAEFNVVRKNNLVNLVTSNN